MATLNAIYKISADISNLQQGMSRAIQATESLDRTVTGIGGTLTRTFAAAATPAAIASLVSSVVALGGELTDLSARTGLSTTALQQFKGVGDQVGVTIDQIASSVNQMQNRLAGGDASALSALRQLGLSWQQLKTQTPEEQFRTIIDRLAQIPNHADMVATGTDLMGRGFQQITPLVKAGIDELDRVSTMSPEAVAGLDAIGDAWARLKTSTLASIGEIVAKLSSFESALASTAEVFGLSGQKIRDDWRLTMAIFEDVDKFKPAIDAPAVYGRAAALQVKTSAADLAAAERQITAQVEKGTRAIVESLREQGRELKRLADEDVKRLVQSYTDLAENLKKLRIVTTGVPEGLAEVGRVGAINIKTIEQAWEDYGEGLKKVRAATVGLGDDFKNLGATGEAEIIRIKASTNELYEAMVSANREGQRMLNATIGQGAGLLSSITGIDVGQILSAVQQVRKAREILNTPGASGTARTGATIGTIAAQATIMVAAWQAVVAAAEKAEFNAGNAQRQFMRAAGALTDFHLAARLANVDVDRLFNIKDQKAFEAAFERAKGQIQQAQEQMERYGLTWRDFSDVTGDFVRYTAIDLIDAFQDFIAQGVPAEKLLKGMSGDFNRLIVDAVQTGKKIPAALRPMLEQLVRTKKLSEEAAAALLGLSEVGGPSFDDVMEAAQRYGIELDALGPKIRGLQIRDIAAQIIKDFELMVAAGGDVNGILLGMQNEVQDVVTSALKLGIALPEGMRPIIEAMIKAGLLTDEFGGKLTDTSRINFAKPLTDKIDELIEAIRALIDETDTYAGRAVEAFGRARNAAESLGKAIPRGFASNPPDQSVPDPAESTATGSATARVLPFTGSSSSAESTALDNNLEITVDGRVLADVTARTYVA